MIGIADSIAKVLKTSGATQAAILDISMDAYKVWNNDLLYKFRLNGVIESFHSGKRLWIVLKQMPSPKCAINAKTFLFNILCFEHKKVK